MCQKRLNRFTLGRRRWLAQVHSTDNPYLGPEPEHNVKFALSKRPVTHCHRAKNLAVQLDLIKCNAIGDAKIEALAHRAHLHRQAHSRKPVTDYDATLCPRMTQ